MNLFTTDTLPGNFSSSASSATKGDDIKGLGIILYQILHPNKIETEPGPNMGDNSPKTLKRFYEKTVRGISPDKLLEASI